MPPAFTGPAPGLEMMPAQTVRMNMLRNMASSPQAIWAGLWAHTHHFIRSPWGFLGTGSFFHRFQDPTMNQGGDDLFRGKAHLRQPGAKFQGAISAALRQGE